MTKSINFQQRGWEEYLYLQEQDKKTLRRINQLLKDIARSPYEGIGKPEALTGDYAGCWSRRIDDKNRLVYKVENSQIQIMQCVVHYDDK